MKNSETIGAPKSGSMTAGAPLAPAQHEPTCATGVSSASVNCRSPLRSSHRDTTPVGPCGSPTARYSSGSRLRYHE